MQKRQLIALTGGAVLAGVLAVGAGPVRADQNPSDQAPSQARAIEGVWEPVVTIRDCASGTPLFTFLSMDSYIRGGSYIGESASEPSRRATGLGFWSHVGGRNFTATFQFFTYDANGFPNGKLKVSANISLSPDGSSFTTTDTTDLLDLAGNVVGQVCGTREATRLQ